MDNLCHALAAVSFGEAGLKRLTPWANASLVLSANIPDVDFVAVFGETPHVLYRRGWSHGILAQALWPVLITGLVVAADRFWARRTGRGPRVRPWAVLALCYLGVLSHVFLDFMNIYGIRLLKPLSERWFYGDALFIIDPWLWLILGLGVFLSRRFRQAAPAAAALAITALYLAGMLWLASAGRANVSRAWTETYGAPPARLMVGPTPLNPLRQEIIVDAGDRYVLGEFSWWPRQVSFAREPIMKNDSGPAVDKAREHPHVRAVLAWARFPHYITVPVESGVRVQVQDARYGRLLGSTSVVVDR